MIELKQVFDKFADLKVLIIGDVMVDAYIWGKVERISPEAPVPVISIHGKESRLGGAANVAKNVHALGAKPYLCSVIGDDDAGGTFLHLLGERGIETSGIVTSDHRTTTVKERILSGAQHLLRVDKETEESINKSERTRLLEKIDDLLGLADVVIFEDYDKGVLSKSIIQYVIEGARVKGIPTAVDPKKRNFMAYHKATLFKPNVKEIKEGLKLDHNLREDAHLVEAVKMLKSKLELEMAMITRSELGMYIDAGKERHFIPAHIRTISDVSGAGDTVVSTAALCLALELPPKFIAELSNLAGGLVCEYPGVVPVDKDQLYQEASKHNLL